MIPIEIIDINHKPIQWGGNPFDVFTSLLEWWKETFNEEFHWPLQHKTEGDSVIYKMKNGWTVRDTFLKSREFYRITTVYSPGQQVI